VQAEAAVHDAVAASTVHAQIVRMLLWVTLFLNDAQDQLASA
jgi:hypothetical protein